MWYDVIWSDSVRRDFRWWLEKCLVPTIYFSQLIFNSSKSTYAFYLDMTSQWVCDVIIWGFRQSSSVYWCMYCLWSNYLKRHMITLIIWHILIDLSYPTTTLRTYFHSKFKKKFPLFLSKPIPIKCINIQSYYLKHHMLYLLLYTTFACMSIPKYFLRASIRS